MKLSLPLPSKLLPGKLVNPDKPDGFNKVQLRAEWNQQSLSSGNSDLMLTFLNENSLKKIKSEAMPIIYAEVSYM